MKKILALFFALTSGFVTPAAATIVDCSGVIATPNTPVTLLAPGAAENGFFIQNIDNKEAVWFSLTGPVQPGGPGAYILPPAQARGFAASNMFESPPGLGPLAFVSVVAATPGHRISCTYW